MDFDTAKENIQPLRGGRRADRLELALDAEKTALDVERKQYEELVNSYKGSDPLSPWYEYICWIEQSYLKSGSESGLDEVVSKCIVEFENDKRYKQDRRLIKLFIKYIDTQDNPQELFLQLYNNGIGTMVADLYIAWSYYFDAVNDFKQVEAIFRKGFDAGAQPFEELTQAHQIFSISMSQRMLYDDESSKQQFQASMLERRNALTSLRAHNKKFVGSIRTGNAVICENPGIVSSDLSMPKDVSKPILVHSDEKNELAMNTSSSIVKRSIIDVSKKNENLHEVGPWTKAKLNKGKGLFGKSCTTTQLDFDIMEDENFLPEIPYNKRLFEKGIKLPSSFEARNRVQNKFNVPMIVEEPIQAKVIPRYNKFMVYPNVSLEMSLEEYRGYRFFKKKGLTTSFTRQYDIFFENKYENGIRIIPGFVKNNHNQDEVMFGVVRNVDESGFQFPIKRIYSNDNEFSNEELLAEKFNKGGIKLVTNDDFDEIHSDDCDMELTLIGDRRQSIYPLSRKSFVPRKSILRKSTVQAAIIEDEEELSAENQKLYENQHRTPRVRFELPVSSENEEKSLMKRKLELDENDESEKAFKTRFISETPPRISNQQNSPDDLFKQPPPVEKKPIRPFEILEEDANDTCSTQQFNFFIKAQSVSTPVLKKTVPRLVPIINTEVSVQSEQKVESSESPISVDAPQVQPQTPLMLHNKLSTIMEITETTHSTKSCESLNSKTSPELKNDSTLVEKDENKSVHNPLTVFRIPEEQTETIALLMKSIKLPKASDINQSLQKSISTASFKVDKLIPVSEEQFLPSSFTNNQNESQKQGLLNIDNDKEKLEILKLPEESFLNIPTLTDFETSRLHIPSVANTVENFKENASKNDCSILKQISSPISSQTFEDRNEIEPSRWDIPEVLLSDLSHEGVSENQSIKILEKEDSHLEIPETQPFNLNEVEKTHLNVSIEPFKNDNNEISHFEIPETQQIDTNTADESHFEIPATQPMELNEMSQIQNKEPLSTEVEVNSVLPFNVYEDSMQELPKPKTQPKIISSNESNILHMSRKENLCNPQLTVKRTISDEFLELCGESPDTKLSKTVTKNNSHEEEMSDLLKFSDMKTNETLESSFKNLVLNAPQMKSASPTMNIFDEDLNTEKFSLPLNCGKNSTLLIEAPQKITSVATNQENKNIDLSFEINEEECNRLGNIASDSFKMVQEVISEPLFKVPMIPKEKKHISNEKEVQKLEFEIFNDEDEDDENNDLCKSIYYSNKSPKVVENDDDCMNSWEDDKMCSFIDDGENRYEYTIIQEKELSLSAKLKEAIAESKGNPFCEKVRNVILEQINFEVYLESHVDTCSMLKNVPKLKIGSDLECATEKYKVTKRIGSGSFGSIFALRNLSNNEIYAAKQEKPPNMWEYYICIELSDRLRSKSIDHMLPAFMHVRQGIIANNASILITEYSPFGTIIDVCNKIKKSTGRNVDEYIGMIFASQLLSIVDFLHSCHIIHADIKPDNFLLMSSIDIGMKVPAIQLIDFGSAIDMECYDKDDAFTKVVTTENFTCCEMRENKPWTYQTDLFGLCGTVHVILFGKYMEVEKKMGHWQIKLKFPRYFQKSMWDIFFDTLLNVPNSKSLPNLQNLKQHLDQEVIGRDKYVRDKISAFNNALLN